VPEDHSRRWLALVLLAATQFMLVIDVSIVNVALPSIQRSLHFNESNLQWVTSAYALTFGGFLLLGGRCADLLGRRRIFMSGLVLFTAASLLCGLSGSAGLLIAARAVQGVGAAIVSPAALSILTNTFAAGAERNKALGIWGAIAGLGGAAGVLLGGVLTDSVGWKWIFLVNVPVGALVFALAPTLLAESKSETAERRFDIAGAVSVTSSLVLLVYATVTTRDHAWTSFHTIGLLAASAVLLVAFILIEQRSNAPLLPLSIFRLHSVAGANVVGLLLGSSIFSMFFFLSLYMQEVLHYSPLRAGVGYLLVAGTIIASAGASQALVTRLGARRILAFGQLMVALGLLWFTQISVSGSYLYDLAPGLVLAGVGLGFSFVPDTIAALDGVPPHQAGIASGLINTSQQVGGALGVAALVTLAVHRTTTLLATANPADVHARLGAFTSGYHWAFTVGAGLALIGVVATLTMVRVQGQPGIDVEPLPEPAA
jgi:EmrB/QacA subfamily drug resistance transporter